MQPNPPYRTTRRQQRAILDADGSEIVVFPERSAEYAEKFCDYLNGRTLQADPKETEIHVMTFQALQDIIEIGKRNMENPKYDSYFTRAKYVIDNPSAALRIWYDQNAGQRRTISNLQSQIERLEKYAAAMEADRELEILENQKLQHAATVAADMTMRKTAEIARLRDALQKIFDGAYNLDNAVHIAQKALTYTEPEIENTDRAELKELDQRLQSAEESAEENFLRDVIEKMTF